MDTIQQLEINFLCSKPNHLFLYGKDLQWKHINENITIYDDLILCKNKIEQLYISESWDKAKKINNDYELIHLPNKRVKSDSIAKYEPLSRAFFKLWELLHLFPSPLQQTVPEPIKIIALAEGPGGFIEAMQFWRKQYAPSIQDEIIGVTLKSTNKEIPGWKKARNFLDNNPNVCIDYCSDNTGNLYNVDNLRYLHNRHKNTVNLVTADGGFDFSDDFNNQEQKSYRIIFCECIGALSTLKQGGMFICKIFDTFSRTTISILQMLKAHFSKVIVTKPNTSRPCNSEKYIVCEGFLGIDDMYLEKCFISIDLWNYIDKQNQLIHSIFCEDEIDLHLLRVMEKFNHQNAEQQIFHIEKTLESIKNKKHLNTKLSVQKRKALEWCKSYNMEINWNSKYIKSR